MADITPFLLALALSAAMIPPLLPVLRKLKFGQTIYQLGPQSHLKKQGTPNMGGLAIFAACCLSWLVSLWAYHGLLFSWVPLVFLAGCMAIGFADDYLKDVKKRHEGLKPLQKIIGQVAAGLFFAFYCAGRLGTSILVPFSASALDLGILYIPLMTLLVIFMTNSANLQDGVDGILSTVSIIGAVFFGIIIHRLEPGAETLSSKYLCFALAGACAGFLFFNKHPARIIMGDTGSMFIGGVFCAAAMLTRLQIWLLPLCVMMIVSSLSVIMQRYYFKATHGKRIFRMSPLHHHFELGGMSENSVVLMYGLITLTTSLLALGMR